MPRKLTTEIKSVDSFLTLQCLTSLLSTVNTRHLSHKLQQLTITALIYWVETKLTKDDRTDALKVMLKPNGNLAEFMVKLLSSNVSHRLVKRYFIHS